MKLFATLIIALFLITTANAQKYCIPPKYKSGPFTGIAKVTFGGMSNSSSTSDGYADFTALADTVEIDYGSGDSIYIDLYYDPSMLAYFEGNLNVRVWIDWNGDYDFEDEGEEVVASIKNCSSSSMSNPIVKFSAFIKTPSNAGLINTRMRVYEDMVETDGHIKPNPCGYLNSSNPLGQHGECEDYTIRVGNKTNVNEILSSNDIKAFPNPAEDVINLHLSDYFSNVKITITDIFCNILIVQNFESCENVELNLSQLATGIYFISINSDGFTNRSKLIKK